MTSFSLLNPRLLDWFMYHKYPFNNKTKIEVERWI